MIPVLAAAGRAVMGLVKGGPKAPPPGVAGGPRGANAVATPGSGAAGKSSPMDMLGNVANLAGVGMMVAPLVGGVGGEKPPAEKPKSAGKDFGY